MVPSPTPYVLKCFTSSAGIPRCLPSPPLAHRRVGSGGVASLEPVSLAPLSPVTQWVTSYPYKVPFSVGRRARMGVEVGLGQAMLGQVLCVLSCLAVPRVRGNPRKGHVTTLGLSFPVV